jgi:hypothetical protein
MIYIPLTKTSFHCWTAIELHSIVSPEQGIKNGGLYAGAISAVGTLKNEKLEIVPVEMR